MVLLQRYGGFPTSNIRLGWEGLIVTNSQASYIKELISGNGISEMQRFKTSQVIYNLIKSDPSQT
jgi:hypothetical protein